VFPQVRLFNKRNIENGDAAVEAWKGMREAFVASYTQTDNVALKIGHIFHAANLSGNKQELDTKGLDVALSEMNQIAGELQRSLTKALGRKPREFEVGLCGFPIGGSVPAYQVPISLPRIVGPDPRFLQTNVGAKADYAKFLAWFEASPVGMLESK
jgi:hypothetical protein